jgi:hypothetical protein
VVTFLSLFLGLVTGVRPVELAVGKDIAAVEIRLDGKLLGVLKEARWRIDVDFGSVPEPHHLEATGFDVSGQQVARVLQKINLRPSLAEANLFIEPGAGGRDRVARLTWQSVIAERPEWLSVTFDGTPIAAPDPARIALPRFVPEQVHFLRADLEFSAGISTSAEITFGGEKRDRTQAELTAVPVLPDKKKLLPERDMEGWFLADGAPVKVVAEEEGPGEIAVVLDEAARLPLARLVESYRPTPILLGTPPFSRARDVAPLKKGQRVRFQWTFPEVHEHSGARFELFPHSQDFLAGSSGLLWMMTHVFPPGVPEERRFADAVAVAALNVSAESRPRAIVLLLAGSKDASALGAAAAQTLLSRLGVPLFVWTVGTGAREAKAWNATWVTDVSTPAAFEKAAWKLVTFVEHERMVWLEGVHLPQSIALSPKASGLALVR